MVSVPLRGLEVFGPGGLTVCVIGVDGFRPLAGIRGLRTKEDQERKEAGSKVSVPLRGLEVFGLGMGSPAQSFIEMFPSPCGD